MNEQLYAGINYMSVHSAEVRLGERAMKTLDQLNSSLHRMYQRALDTVADMVIRKLDL